MRMRRFIIGLLIMGLFIGNVYATDKAVVYDDTNRKIKVSDPLPIAQGGTGSATKNFVDLSTAQEVGGIKTLTSIPVLPASDPTSDNQASRKAYTDTKISKTTAGEINAMAEKTALNDNDLLLIEDSEAGNAKKKVKKSNISSGRIQIFTSTGTFTSGTGITSVYVTLCGGGGGGGGGHHASGHGGGGGGSGAYASKVRIAVTPTTGYTVTVGALGSGGANGSSGAAGGVSSFAGDSVTVSVNGGGGGVSPDTGGIAGAASTTTAVMTFAGRAGQTAGVGNGANGAGGFSGTGGAGGTIGLDGSPALGYGAGGGGGYATTPLAGGNGTAGFCLVEW